MAHPSLCRLMGKLTLLPLLLICLAHSGCRKKPGTSNAPVIPASEVAASVGVKPSDLPSQKVLYDAIAKYMSQNQGRAAKDLDELVQKGFLKPLPPLPAGKRYELDQRSTVLSIVDK